MKRRCDREMVKMRDLKKYCDNVIEQWHYRHPAHWVMASSTQTSMARWLYHRHDNISWSYHSTFVIAVIWLKYCRYFVKPNTINQSINRHCIITWSSHCQSTITSLSSHYATCDMALLYRRTIVAALSSHCQCLRIYFIASSLSLADPKIYGGGGGGSGPGAVEFWVLFWSPLTHTLCFCS